jgi:two-component system, LuxR family, response regulator FixJ
MAVHPVVHIVDDDPAIIRLLTELVKAIGLDVDAYQSAEEFRQAYQASRPGCLVLDVRIPGMSGMELQKQLTAARCTLPIVFITGHADVRMAVEAMERGAFGFLEKPFRPQELCEKIESAVRLDMETWRRREHQESAAARLARLTPAERKVAERVIAGSTNKMIAQELGLSTRTIEAQRARLMERLGIKSRTELVGLMAAIAPLNGYGEEHSLPISRNQDAARRAEHVRSYLRARHGD